VKSADEGDALGAGDRVRTGEDGRAEIALWLDAPVPELDAAPAGRDAPGTTGVELDRGTSLFEVLRRGDSFEVHTPRWW
jgi:hypothetical protein